MLFPFIRIQRYKKDIKYANTSFCIIDTCRISRTLFLSHSHPVFVGIHVSVTYILFINLLVFLIIILYIYLRLAINVDVIKSVYICVRVKVLEYIVTR